MKKINFFKTEVLENFTNAGERLKKHINNEFLIYTKKTSYEVF